MRKLAASLIIVVSISVICLGESKLIQVPICRQATDYTCGVASMQSVLGYYGMDQTRGDQRQDQLAKALKAHEAEERVTRTWWPTPPRN